MIDEKKITEAVNAYIGYPKEIDEGIETSMRRDAFKAGVEWFKKALWHDANLKIQTKSNKILKNKETMETNIGKKVIIRGDRSGVEFGTLVAQNGREVTLRNARRLWYWDGAASLSQLAKDGTTIPRECKFTVTVDSITILDAIEIIPCTDKAIKSIEEVREWKR